MTPHGGGSDRLGRWLVDLLRAAQWHRRLLAAGLLAGSVAAGLHAIAPAPPASSAVLAAARDLPAGTRLDAEDVAVVRLEPSAVPDGALRRGGAAQGRTLVSAVRRGEPLTDVRVVGPGAVDRLGPGLVASPVRVADAEAVRLLKPGDVVDVLAAGVTETPAPARLVAAAAQVLALPRGSSDTFGRDLGDGGLVLLATTPATAARLAGASVTDRLSLVLRGG